MKLTNKVLLAGVALAVLGGGFGSGPVLAIGLAMFITAIVAKIAARL